MFEYYSAAADFTCSYEFKHIWNTYFTLGNAIFNIGQVAGSADSIPLIAFNGIESIKKERHKISLLCNIDYYLYVPFNKRGIEQVKKCLNLGSNAEYVKYRTERFIEFTKENTLQPIDDDYADAVFKFNTYLTADKQDLSVPESVAAMLRLVLGEFENLSLKSENPITNITIPKDALGILKKIREYMDEHGPIIDLNDFMTIDTTPLNEEEKIVFEKATNIKV